MFNLFKEKHPARIDSAATQPSEPNNFKFRIYFVLILGTVLSLFGMLYALRKYLSSHDIQFPNALLAEMQQLTVQLQESIDGALKRIHIMDNLIEEKERQFQEGEREKERLKAQLAELEPSTPVKTPVNFLEQRHSANVTTLAVLHQIFTKPSLSKTISDKGLASLAPENNPTLKIGLLEILESFAQKHQGYSNVGSTMKRFIRLCRFENDAIEKLLADGKQIAAHSQALINTIQEELIGTKEKKEKKHKLVKIK